ncbi:MEDS domain-containing protein [Streptomyces megasporus]|uniref:MEDS domain-containing protein n=1 Tax=Streptomyces megasporus TaxID=44060 RepID=UPI0004E21564|nr:MEDS domain-containing protein [Streptomyces megasporus]
MAVWNGATDHTIAVEGLRPGDHAFVGYADEPLWPGLAAFTHDGLVRGEKVVLFPDPALPVAETERRLLPFASLAEAARSRGQLLHSSVRELIRPDGGFTPRRQTGRLREETERALREGYAGLRVYVDMAWVWDLDVDIETVTHREAHAEHLFADGRYTEVCAYDRRRFDDEVLTAVRRLHPVDLLERPGDLGAVYGTDEVGIIGDADLATRDGFHAALRTVLTPRGRTSPVRVDLSRLCFLDIGCASLLLRQAAGAGARRVEILCGAPQADLLRRLGAHSVENLVVVEV